MYSATHPVSTSMNNGMGGGMIDGSGTINPAALNTPGRTLFPLKQLFGVEQSRRVGDVPQGCSPVPTTQSMLSLRCILVSLCSD